jgi:hypothetical protein
VCRHRIRRLYIPYNMHTSIARDQHSNSFFLNSNQTYQFFFFSGTPTTACNTRNNMQPQPPRVSQSSRSVSCCRAERSIQPARAGSIQRSCVTKALVAQSIQMHCYAVFIINSGHYQCYSRVINDSKMNLFTDPVPTSQNTHYSFITKENILFKKNLLVAKILLKKQFTSSLHAN